MSKIEDIEHKISKLSDYIEIRLAIISHDPEKWLGMWKPQLPSFDYYYQKCVLDQGGPYDFTKRNLKSHMKSVYFPVYMHHGHQKTGIPPLRLTVEYSSWMGTPFNFKGKIGGL